MLRVLGARADHELAPASGRIGALFELPPGRRAEDYQAVLVAPGIARVRGSSQELLRYGSEHPELRFEVNAPLHLLNANIGRSVKTRITRAAGATGEGVLVGVADTGLDVTHPDFLDENGKSRVAWMLDLSRETTGLHPEVEVLFRSADAFGKTKGAVYTGEDLDRLRADPAQAGRLPRDVNGHGTHVASIAAGNGGLGEAASNYIGAAPKAKLIIVRLTRTDSGGIETDDLVTATKFIFDRADAEKKPAVANMSLGTDFGPHDGTLLWERAVASYVGPDKPGHVIVAAAGNSGSIEDPIHQSVYVAPGAKMRVPIIAPRSISNGRVQIWVTKARAANLAIGLEGPDGEWIAPFNENGERGDNADGHNAGIFQGPSSSSPVPEGTNGAVIVWAGAWPSGTYNVVFDGEGMAELYLQTFGEASGAGGGGPVRFARGVRAGTINLPASHPDIIGVGCTVNQAKWRSIEGFDIGPVVPLTDGAGGLPADGTRESTVGEVCWFSSAGPNAAGVPKPEIAAPGSGVTAAMSDQARPSSDLSIFSGTSCPLRDGKQATRCLQVDDRHAVSSGTSMSSPVVAGVAALLLQREPTLTQAQVRVLLQAGAHNFRGPAPYQGQAGPGEVDAPGALEALNRMKNPVLSLPVAATSWLSTSVDHVAADGSSAATVYLELRNAEGTQADLFEASRLQPTVAIDGVPVSAVAGASPVSIVRRAPGLYTYSFVAPPGRGGSTVTFGATFDGAPVVASRTIPIAADGWRASYGARMNGFSCTSADTPYGGLTWLLPAGLITLVWRARRRRAAR
jgi:subtilisin family serine protease